MSTLNLMWSIDGAVVNFDDIEDDNTKIAMDKVRSLCLQNRHEDAVKSLPAIDFEFDAGGMDSDPSAYFLQTAYCFTLNTESNDCSIQVGMHGGYLALSISVVFQVEVKDGTDIEEFNQWLSDNGARFAGYASGGWSYHEDHGVECLVDER